MKKENGITLVALVVTIIVLLILAGISIGTLTGNNGIINQAENAKDSTEYSQWEEQIDLAIIDAENKNRNPQLADVINELINRGVIDNESQVNEENGDIETNEPVYIITGKLDDYLPYIPVGLEIGSEVIYEPIGTYNWLAKYYNFKNVNSLDITLDSSNDEFKISNWRVLEIDRENEQIILVPTSETIGTVPLRNAQGYNNAVYLLNEACSELYGYGGEKSGITARSIKIEDIENYMTDEALEEAHNYISLTGNGTRYGEKISSAYATNKYYPSIYEQEIKSVIDGEEKTTGLGLSEQNSLVEPTKENDSSNGLASKTATLQPYQTYWNESSEFMLKAFQNIEDSNNVSNYYNLIIPNGKSTTYWIASRCINNSSSQSIFSTYYIKAGAMGDGSYTAGIYINCTGGVNALFPIVTINSKYIGINESGEYEVNVE